MKAAVRCMNLINNANCIIFNAYYFSMMYLCTNTLFESPAAPCQINLVCYYDHIKQGYLNNNF